MAWQHFKFMAVWKVWIINEHFQSNKKILKENHDNEGDLQIKIEITGKYKIDNTKAGKKPKD